MRAEGLALFPHINLTLIAFIIFVVVFFLQIIFLMKLYSREKIEKLESMPLGDDHEQSSR